MISVTGSTRSSTSGQHSCAQNGKYGVYNRPFMTKSLLAYNMILLIAGVYFWSFMPLLFTFYTNCRKIWLNFAIIFDFMHYKWL